MRRRRGPPCAHSLVAHIRISAAFILYRIRQWAICIARTAAFPIRSAWVRGQKAHFAVRGPGHCMAMSMLGRTGGCHDLKRCSLGIAARWTAPDLAPSLSGTRNLRLTPSYWRMVTRHLEIAKPKGASLKVPEVSWKKMPATACCPLATKGGRELARCGTHGNFSVIGLPLRCIRHCCRCRTLVW